MVSLTRTIAPVVAGSTFAFSLSLGSGWYTIYLAFALCSVFFAVCHAVACSLPTFLDNAFDPDVSAAEAARRRRRTRKVRSAAGDGKMYSYDILM